MKEALAENLVPESKETIQVVAPIMKELKQIGSMRRIPGHKNWKINLTNLRVSELDSDDFERFVHLDGKATTKIIIKENHLYCQALNRKNAYRRFGKMLDAQGYKAIIKDQPDA